MDCVKLNGGGSLSSNNLKKALYELLLEKTRKLGRALSFEEARNDPEFPNPNEYAQYYGSFSDAAADAFRKVEFEKEYPDGLPGDKSDELRIGAYSSAAAQRNGFEKVSRRRPVATFSEEPRLRRGVKEMSSRKQESEAKKMAEKSSVNRDERKKEPRIKWTKETIVEVVKKFYDENGRLPSMPDFRGGCDYLPAEMTVRKHLGKKDAWLAAIGVSKEEFEGAAEQAAKADSSGEGPLSHDEIDTMLSALANDYDEKDDGEDAFAASGSMPEAAEPGSESDEPESTEVETELSAGQNEVVPVLVVSKALNKFLEKIQDKLEIKDAAIDVVVSVVGQDEPISLHLEF